ncbi:hypothetical protein B0T14DRAFT_566441 [Immersiella caudata]|uniref:Uncharacterized protein n=1 Tax=Immersiella caudata TaxID=314043 RepID=A0AA40BZK4_9PEZI|nr:hypothetical protein B0T14DRAFT_566441 [Immersiella caudata]
MEIAEGNFRVKKWAVDDAHQHSGKNVKGYQPGQQDRMKHDLTYPQATLHGNQQYPGARLDKELQEEDEATIRKKDERKENA